MKNYDNIAEIKLTTKEIFYHSIIFFLFNFSFWLIWSLNSIKTPGDFFQLVLYSLTYFVVIFINIHYLYKKYYFKGEYLIFAIFTIISFQSGYLLQQLIYNPDIDYIYNHYFRSGSYIIRDMVVNTFTFIMFGAFAHFTIIIHKWQKAQNILIESEKLKLELELANLKNQISPHFLFNTLNNLYVLSKSNPEQASESILNLSDLLRYQLKVMNVDFTLVNDELEYITNLLKLEIIRRDNLEVSYDIKTNYNHKIEPMIFSTLVENAIKHGSQKLKDCQICVKVIDSIDNITFEIINNFNNNTNIDFNFGSGLNNLKRRLDIKYQNNYHLDFNIDENLFKAKLKVNIR